MRRSKKTLSETSVKRLKADPEGKFVQWDNQVPGFGIQVTPAGSKSWIVQFDRKGKKVGAAIGSFPTWSVEEARGRAGELRKLHDEGHDIKAFLQEQQEGKDLHALVDLWRDDYSGDRKPSTLKGYESVLKATILPKLGKRLVKDLTYADIRAFYNGVKKKTPIRANRSIAMLSKLMNIAEKEGWRPASSNPCKQIEKGPEKARTRKLSCDELSVLESTLSRFVTQGYKAKTPKSKIQKLDPMVADLVRFLAFSGLRRGEALGLQWSDVDLEANVMKFEVHKTDQNGAKELPLNGALREVLTRRAGFRLSAFVFPGLTLQAAFQGLGKWWTRIVEESGLPNFTPHDLRRTFNSVCAELGFPPQAFDLLLGHSLGGVRDTYTVMGAGTGLLAQASEDTSAWIQAAMNGQNPTVGEKIAKKEEQKEA